VGHAEHQSEFSRKATPQQWNLTLQRQLPWSFNVEGRAYVANKGTNLGTNWFSTIFRRREPTATIQARPVPFPGGGERRLSMDPVRQLEITIRYR